MDDVEAIIKDAAIDLNYYAPSRGDDYYYDDAPDCFLRIYIGLCLFCTLQDHSMSI